MTREGGGNGEGRGGKKEEKEGGGMNVVKDGIERLLEGMVG